MSVLLNGVFEGAYHVTVNGTEPVPALDFGIRPEVLYNTPPVADAGGPYTAAEGGSTTLDASASSDSKQSTETLVFAWDFDGDGQYDDATGISPTLSAAGLDGPTTRTVGLRVTDDDGANDTSTRSQVFERYVGRGRLLTIDGQSRCKLSSVGPDFRRNMNVEIRPRPPHLPTRISHQDQLSIKL